MIEATKICRHFGGVDERDGTHIVKCGVNKIEFGTMEEYREQSEFCVGGNAKQCKYYITHQQDDEVELVSAATIEQGLTDTRKTEATELHQYIIAQGRVMAQAMSEVGRCLKRMRDEKLYTALGYESFEGYTQQLFELKQRQAYNYIKVYETYGARFLDEHAQLGVSKLLLLADVPAPEREDFLTENNINELSTRQLAELTEKYNKQAEQLTLLQGELTREKADVNQTAAELARTLEHERQRYRESEATYLTQLREMENRPVEVAVQEPSEQMLASIRQEERERAEETARREAYEQFKEQKQQAQSAQQQAEQHAKEQIELANAAVAEAERRANAAEQERTALAENNSELENIRQRARELEQKLQVAENPISLRVSFGFEQLQAQLESIGTWISEAPAAEATKYRAAAKALLLQMVAMFEEG